MADPNALRHYQQRIEREFPSLGVTSVRFKGRGDNNDVVVVNDALIFRFPRHPQGIEQLEREAALLRAIRQRVSLPIPDPVFSGSSTSPGEAFMGYQALPGHPFTHDAVSAVKGEVRIDAIAAGLVSFLRELHDPSVLSVLPAQFLAESPLACWQALYGRVRDELFPLMGPRSRREIASRFEEFLDEAQSADWPRVLIHGDFGGGNILVDPSTGTLTGVVDFGSAHVDDPAVDFAAASTIDPDLYRRMSAMDATIAEAQPRADLYRSTFTLQAWLYELHHGNQDALREWPGHFAE
jgi:aminoglycoside 2''-phosphotransferase